MRLDWRDEGWPKLALLRAFWDPIFRRMGIGWNRNTGACRAAAQRGAVEEFFFFFGFVCLYPAYIVQVRQKYYREIHLDARFASHLRDLFSDDGRMG